MAKKKKGLKPVARGFATTSVPKKPIHLEEPQDTREGVGDTPGTQSSDTPTVPVEPPQTDQAVLEVDALQAIVEKFQDKTEKDVVRNLKVWCPLASRTNTNPLKHSCPGQAIEQERRFAQTLPMLNLDPIITDRILELALEGEKKGEKIGGELVTWRSLGIP